jgi:hypothetical protein
MSTQRIDQILGKPGKMISASKGQYNFDNPDNFVIFNANVCTETGKLWHGDLDLTLELDKLIQAATELDLTLYILYEMDARFENENKPLIEKAALTVHANGTHQLRVSLKEFYNIDKGVYKLIKTEPEAEKELPLHLEGDYFEENYIKLLKIDSRKLKGSKTKGPLEQLDKLLIKEFESRRIDISTIEQLIFSKVSEVKLTELIKTHLINIRGLKEGTYGLQRELNWIPFFLPATFQGSKKGPTWAEDNCIYVRLKHEE